MPQNDYAHKTKARVHNELGLLFVDQTMNRAKPLPNRETTPASPTCFFLLTADHSEKPLTHGKHFHMSKQRANFAPTVTKGATQCLLTQVLMAMFLQR